jgi:hypothetical protein
VLSLACTTARRRLSLGLYDGLMRLYNGSEEAVAWLGVGLDNGSEEAVAWLVFVDAMILSPSREGRLISSNDVV